MLQPKFSRLGFREQRDYNLDAATTECLSLVREPVATTRTRHNRESYIMFILDPIHRPGSLVLIRNRVLCLFILILSTAACAQEELLNKLVGRILVIRNFYTEPLLRYDASGHIKHRALSGDWTTAQFKIEKASLNDKGFVLTGKRVAVGYNERKDDITFYQLEPLTIKVEDLPPDTLTQQKLDELIHQIFVVLKDEPETVPEYWRDLVLGNVVADKNEKGHKVYRLKSDPPLKQRRLPAQWLGRPGLQHGIVWRCKMRR